ncbi:iron-dicitrate ABC transporter ATP-binding protein [Paractinoplanes abujensis]|uniref:Iron complex transport system ATP-binding protein n=1 Tax=Paractinoplanes abujensis TaxID=882441 RepID=A0A7W7G4P2_9ACTN|nr:ABC transporter ATP-binding protein [Actinoplanes abujensis]MBB4695500.1 iron complex transport system ATP-binding protein [Actinoplanes abujensis]GID23084.1 iron-dicitrate ABC transporter ATP-binding protein [Actinoplanes abujensis]
MPLDLQAERLSLGYGERTIVRDLSLHLPRGKVTIIVGPNACGKSTFLRGLARLLPPASGRVLLDGKSIHSTPSREVALELGILPQGPIAPDGITVTDLVSRGRHVHQGWFRRWSSQDDDAVTAALTATGTLPLAARPVDELSGGQRQRVWIAMALAQRTGILLLDEPTTYLDISHQVEVLDLLTDLNEAEGTTVVIVLHELNLAFRYADHVVVMKDGAVVTAGDPNEVLTEQIIADVFGIRCKLVDDPVSNTPMIVPIGRHRVGVQEA